MYRNVVLVFIAAVFALPVFANASAEQLADEISDSQMLLNEMVVEMGEGEEGVVDSHRKWRRCYSSYHRGCRQHCFYNAGRKVTGCIYRCY